MITYLGTYVGLLWLRVSRIQGLYYPLFIGLFFFSAFRFEVGCDWGGYLNQFQVFSPTPSSEILGQSDPLWVALFVFQRWLELPYPWINVFSSVLFFAGIHVLARRQPDPFSFLLLLFPILIVNMPMSGIRQASAIGLMCMAFVAFVDQKPARFVGFVLLAAALHTSAILFLFLAPLVPGEYTRSRLLLAALLAIPGAIALSATEAATVAIERYVNTGLDAAGAWYRAGLLAVTAAFTLAYALRPWRETRARDYKLMVIAALLMVVPIAIVPFSSVVADRLGYYLIPLQTVIYVRLPYLHFKANSQWLTAAPYLGLLLVFGVWTSRSMLFRQCYVPYQSWMFGFPEARMLF